MSLVVNVSVVKSNSTHCSIDAERIGQCDTYLMARMSAVEDADNLANLMPSLYNGDQITFLSESGPFIPGPGFYRVKFTVPYFGKSSTGAPDFHGAIANIKVDTSQWIPETFKSSFPKRTEHIKRAVSKLFNSSSDYQEKHFVLTFWDGKLTSISTGIIPVWVTRTSGTDPKDTATWNYRLFCMPTNHTKEEIVLTAFNEPTRHHMLVDSYMLTPTNPRVVIGQGYFRFAAYEMTNNDFSILMYTDEIKKYFNSVPTGTRRSVLDIHLGNLLLDSNIPIQLLLDCYSQYSLDGCRRQNSTVGGLVLNTDQWDSNALYNKLTFTPGELAQLREAIDCTSVYLRSPIDISFSSHLSKKNQKIQLETFCEDKIGVVSKSTKKVNAEVKAFKTRVFTSFSSYLLSICYSIVFHNDLILPEGCALDTLGFKRLLVTSHSRRYDWGIEPLNTDACEAGNPVVLDDAQKAILSKNAAKFINDYRLRSITVSPMGNSSVVSSYFYNESVPRNNNSKYAWAGWICSLDTSINAYYCKHVAGFPRAHISGMNMETQAISSRYFLRLLRLGTNWEYDPYVGTKGSNSYFWSSTSSADAKETENYKTDLSKALNQFYLDNVIPNPVIEDAFENASKSHDPLNFSSRDLPDIKYVEFFTLHDDSVTLLQDGYKCKTLPSLFEWWSTTSTILRSKVSNDSRYSQSELSFVNYLLDSTDYIVTTLLNHVSELD